MSSKIYAPTHISGTNLRVISKEMQKTATRFTSMSNNELFVIKWKGLDVNVLPFLVNASSFYSSDFRSTLYGSIARIEDIPSYKELRNLNADELYDVDFMACLIPSTNNVSTKELCMYLYTVKPKELALALLKGANEILKDFVSGRETPHYNFQFKGICNTQAFSFYMSLYWVLYHTPYARVMLSKDLKGLNFDELLPSLMPEESLHYRCLSGEITSEELLTRYYDKEKWGYPDKSSVYWRELLSVISEGTYDGHDVTPMERRCCDMVYDVAFDELDYKLNMGISYCLVFSGGYDRLLNKASTAKMDVERTEGLLDKAKSQLSAVRQELKSVKEELSDSQGTVKTLESELHKRDSADAYLAQIKKLEAQLREKDDEITRLFNERGDLKREVSSQKKQIKRLMSSVDVSTEAEDTSCSLMVESELFNLESAIEKLKDKRLMIVGLDFSTSIDKKLEEFGFKHVFRFSRGTRTMNNIDFAIIMTNRCHHSDVYRMEKLARGTSAEVVYFSGSNVNQLLEVLYNELEE